MSSDNSKYVTEHFVGHPSVVQQEYMARVYSVKQAQGTAFGSILILICV